MCAMRGWPLLILLAGCAAPGGTPSKPKLPPVATRVEAWVGTHLSGAKADAPVPADAPAELVQLDWSWSWGTDLAMLAPEELAAAARLHVAVDRAEPFPVVTGHEARTRMAAGAAREAFDRASAPRTSGSAKAEPALLFGGATARCLAQDTTSGETLAEVEVQWTASGALDLAWVVPAQSVDEEGERSAYRERLLYDAAAQLDGAGVAFVLPGAVVERVRASDGGVKELRSDLVLRLSAARVSGADAGERWTAMRELLRATGDSASRGGRVPSRDESFLEELADAWSELAADEHRRAAWLHLAGALGAPLAQDYGFLAGDAELAVAAAELSRSIGVEQLRAQSAAQSAVIMETQVLKRMTVLSGEGKLDDELRGLLLLHTGEAGRWPGAFDDLVRDARSVDELRARIVKENEAFLEDANPAARIRAHDWLAARGLSVPGYDPMAEREARSAALARWEEAREPLEATP